MMMMRRRRSHQSSTTTTSTTTSFIDGASCLLLIAVVTVLLCSTRSTTRISGYGSSCCGVGGSSPTTMTTTSAKAVAAEDVIHDIQPPQQSQLPSLMMMTMNEPTQRPTTISSDVVASSSSSEDDDNKYDSSSPTVVVDMGTDHDDANNDDTDEMNFDKESTTTTNVTSTTNTTLTNKSSSQADTDDRRNHHHHNHTKSDSANDTNDINGGVIVVALVDGTLVGLSRTTGATIWKQQQQQQEEIPSATTTTHPQQYASNHQYSNPDRKNTDHHHHHHPLVQPLVSTTTTTRTMRENVAQTTDPSSPHHHHHQRRRNTMAVPSISDGKVYLTSTSEDCRRRRRHRQPHDDEESDNDDDDDRICDIVEDTVTTTMQQLVHRTPFVDMNNHGRIYTSHRHSVAVAIHSSTGRPIRTVTTTTPTTKNDDTTSNNHKATPTVVDPIMSAIHNVDDEPIENDTNQSNKHVDDTDDDILWLGRTDYTISVHEPITGELDVQFTMAEMMSIHDMLLPSSSYNSNIKEQQQQQILRQYLLPHQTTNPTVVSTTDDVDLDIAANNRVVSSSSSTKQSTYGVIATPNGHVAYRNLYTGQILWVATEAFRNTPAVYAFDATSGHSVPVDIVPDVISPFGTMEYVTNELQQQLLLYNDGRNLHHDRNRHHPYESMMNEPVFGSLPGTGQIYAIPLLQPHKVPTSTTTMAIDPLVDHQKPMYYSADNDDGNQQATSTMMTRSIPDAARDYVTGTQHQTNGIEYNHHRHHQQQRSSLSSGNTHYCHPNSPQYPRCLSYFVSQSNDGGGNPDRYHSNNNHHHRQFRTTAFPNSLSDVSSFQYPANGYDDAVVPDGDSGNNNDGAIVPFYHPDYGYQYIPPNHFYTIHTAEYNEEYRRKKRYRKLMRIVMSWIVPTVVAAIFVMSFELGRRKRYASLSNSDSDVVSTTGHPRESFSDVGIIQVNEDVILGHGGHGTVVYKGMLEGRQVAVKRLLKTYSASADREISLLIESDGHPNVVRYHLKETRGDFVYLALELCDLSLHDLIGHIRSRLDRIDVNNVEERENILSSTKTVLLQITKGVQHLHRLRIVHRDLKPANILLANIRGHKTNNNDTTNSTIYETFIRGDYIAKISDMGLGKQLAGQSSYGGSMYNESSLRRESNGVQSSIIGIGPGSVGWQAPEVMRLRMPSDASVKSDDVSIPYDSGSDFSPIDVPSHWSSRSVDVFSLGCIFYSSLVPGSHPFGEWYEREGNILHNKPNLTALEMLSLEAYDLISLMLRRDPLGRPTTKQVGEHPFFWTSDRRLSLLCDLSDRLEQDAVIANGSEDASFHSVLLAVEKNAIKVVGTSWDRLLDAELINNVQRFRSYDPSSIRDLLRLIRNKFHHFDELPDSFKELVGSKPDGLSQYFAMKFPRLLLHAFYFCQSAYRCDDILGLKYAIPSIRASPKIRNNSTTLNKTTEIVGCQIKEIDSTICESKSNETEPILLSCSEPFLAETPTLERSNNSSVIRDDFSEDGVSEPAVSDVDALLQTEQEDVIIWAGSTSAKTFQCRGWNRSDDEWQHQSDLISRRRDVNLIHFEDNKYRTRFCNHWDESLGTFCPMRKKNKCIFAHGPIELRVKEAKRNRWGKLVDENGDCNNGKHSGGEDTYGAARSIENERKQEGKWNKKAGNVATGKVATSKGAKKKKSEIGSGLP